jgi:hypothetical protein
MTTKLENVNVTMNYVDRKAMIALAEAVKANAEALSAIANMGKTYGPTYGVFVERGDS